MIEIKQRTDPADAFVYAEHFIGEIDVEQLADELFDRMHKVPDDTLLLTAEKDGKVVGVMTAWVIPERDYVWIDQCWYAPELQGTVEGNTLAKDVMTYIERWAAKKGKKKLRMQTLKGGRAWAARWGFEEIMTVMEKGVKTGIEASRHKGTE